jgi:hypothetical protein
MEAEGELCAWARCRHQVVEAVAGEPGTPDFGADRAVLDGDADHLAASCIFIEAGAARGHRQHRSPEATGRPRGRCSA